MKNFTKFFCAAALCLAGAMSANAQDTTVDLTAEMFYNWNGYGADATATSPANVDINYGQELEQGSVVIGTGSVFHLVYADLTGYTKMLFEGTAGTPLRVLMNRQESDSGPLTEKNPSIGEDGTAELDLTDFEYVHLNAIKINWGGKGTVTSIKLVKPADPLEAPKEALKKAIATAKMYTPVAKTAESFAALEIAIEKAELALEAEDATEESLTAAKEEVNAAVEGLEVAEGYTKLTAEMFYNWNGYGADATSTSQANVEFNTSVGAGAVVCGTSTVDYLIYADLTGYSKMVFEGTTGTPLRVLLNRQESNNGPLEERNPTIGDDKTAELDLTEFEYVHLNAIKTGWGGGGTVVGIYLYKGTATGINNVNAAAQSANVYYDLQGRRVANPANGLYIVNGKKVVVK